MLLKPDEIKEIIKIVPKRLKSIDGHIPSAVLMLFFNKENKTNLVYIRRTPDMKMHSGQIAFPGGKIDSNDISSYAAAVRETYEEIGIEEKQISFLGEMGFFHTYTTRYDAAAHIVWSPKPPAYKINEGEVAEVIEIPVQTLMRQFNPDLKFRNIQDMLDLKFQYQPKNFPETVIVWGLTARITHHFIQGLVEFSKNKS